MALESSSGLGVFNNYGPTTTEGKFGAEAGEGVIKTVVYDISWQDLNSTTDTSYTYNGLDYVYPIGSTFLSCQYVVDEAIVGPTAITAGTYTFNTSTKAITAHDADGLMTAAVGVVSALDAVGDRVIGTGALVATGTGAAFAVAAPVVVRFVPTVAIASAGKMRVIVEYIQPIP